MKPATMDEIEAVTKLYAGARAELAAHVTALNDELAAVKHRHSQRIQNALLRTRETHAHLHEMVSGSRELFDSPKTRVLHGIKLGWQKQKGQILIEDEAATVAALRRLLGEESAGYIKVTEKPIRNALANLAASTLKKCGVTVTNDTDAVFIKATDGEIAKLVDALLGKAAEAEVDA